jgi:hypothetical protein
MENLTTNSVLLKQRRYGDIKPVKTVDIAMHASLPAPHFYNWITSIATTKKMTWVYISLPESGRKFT